MEINNKTKEMNMIQMYPQGDCVLVRLGFKKSNSAKDIKTIPESARKIETNLVLKGSTNSHALFGGEFEIFKTEKPNEGGVDTFVRVTKESNLHHVEDLKTMKKAEHDKHIISEGEYLLQPVMETDHINEEQRRIID